MKKIDFNKNWLFKKENEQDYIKVDLPHTYNDKDGLSGNGIYKGKGIYQKEFDYSNNGKHLFLEFGAVGLVAEVFVNDKLIKLNKCGYSMFRVKLDDYLKEGQNTIKVVSDNSKMDDVYPLMADFIFYGGIYRNVYLIETEDLHFDLLDKTLNGLKISQSKTNDNDFKLEILSHVTDEKNEVKADLKVTLLDGNKEVISKCEAINSNEVITDFTVENPHLWNGVKDPYLYQLKFELIKDDRIFDEAVIEYGFRTISYDKDTGLTLNGKKIVLHGVSRHQDYYGIGNAITKKEMEEDMDIILDMGVNSLRLAHYQHDDYFYQLCDKKGILVWAEIPFISIPTGVDPNNTNAKEQLENLILQAYNHPSIYCWGVQNEITIAVENERIYKMVEDLISLAKSLDSQRLLAQANIHSVSEDSHLNTLTELIGYNLYYGWYYGTFTDLKGRLDAIHEKNSSKGLILSEYGVDTNVDYHSYEPKVMDYTEEYQTLYHLNAINTLKESPYMVGSYVWNMFDFGSDFRKEGGKLGINQKGLVSFDRKTRKDSFYLYKAAWSEEKFVHLASKRFVNRHKRLNNIEIISNINKLKLFVNDSLVGEVDNDNIFKVFKDIEFSANTNSVKVIAYHNDEEVVDEASFNLVSEADKSYIIEKKESSLVKGNVDNWFEQFDLAEFDEIVVNEGYYSIYDSIEDIYKNDESKAVFKKYFRDLADSPGMELMLSFMTIESMSKRSRFKIPKKLLPVVNNELNKIKK